MGHIQNSKTAPAKRRFVLADKFAPKAEHNVALTESTAFGGATPCIRQDERGAKDTPADLQDSIKSILADFK